MRKCLFYCLLFVIAFHPLLSNGQQSNNSTVKVYYRHLNQNHMTPYIDYEGRYRISANEAENVNHYCFTYKNHRLASIEETGTDYSWIMHPLLFIGSKNIKFTYSPGKRIARYYDEQGTPAPNYKGVYMEETLYNKKGQKTNLKYYDYKGHPMEGVWNISEYKWIYKDSLVIEYRKNLKGDLVDVSPYFPFRISGFCIDLVQHCITHYDLDKNLHIINSPEGIAYYEDKENVEGDQLYWEYYDSLRTMKHPYGYDRGVNQYDKKGNLERINFYVGEKLVSYRAFTYDSKGSIKSYLSVWNGSEQKISSANDILNFTVPGQVKPSLIDTVSHIIKVYVPEATDLSYIVPRIEASQGAFVYPASNIPVDFTRGNVNYEVIAQNTTYRKVWTVAIEKLK
jgi:hypothetical protein